MDSPRTLNMGLIIRRPDVSGREEHLPFFKSSNIPCFLSFFLPFFHSLCVPLPQGEVYLSPYPSPGQQLAGGVGKQTSSEHTLFAPNFCLNFWWHVGDLFNPQSSKRGLPNEAKRLPESILKCNIKPWNYHKKTSAWTSITMLPCWRGVQLPKSASFTRAHENVRTSHTIFT